MFYTHHVCNHKSNKKWRQYLLGHKFRVYMNHHNLKDLLTQTIQTPEQHKWLTKLLGYDFELNYKLRKENKVVDALSRINTPTVLAISSPTATWLKTLRSCYTTNPEGTRLLTKLEQQPSSLPYHTLHNGLVYIQGRLLIPNIPHIHLLLL